MLGAKSTPGASGASPYTPTVGARQQVDQQQTQQNIYGGFQPPQQQMYGNQNPGAGYNGFGNAGMQRQQQMMNQPPRQQMYGGGAMGGSPIGQSQQVQRQQATAQALRQQPGMPDNTTMNYNGFGDPMAQRQQMMMNQPPRQQMDGGGVMGGGTPQMQLGSSPRMQQQQATAQALRQASGRTRRQREAFRQPQQAMMRNQQAAPVAARQQRAGRQRDRFRR